MFQSPRPSHGWTVLIVLVAASAACAPVVELPSVTPSQAVATPTATLRPTARVTPIATPNFLPLPPSPAPEAFVIIDRAIAAVPAINGYVDGINAAKTAGTMKKAAAALLLWTEGELEWIDAHPADPCVADRQAAYREMVDRYRRIADTIPKWLNEDDPELSAMLWDVGVVAQENLARVTLNMISGEWPSIRDTC